MLLSDQYPKYLQQAIEAFASLPGIGEKSALRLALFLLKQDKVYTYRIIDNLKSYIDGITYCERCHNISDTPVCTICDDKTRDNRVLCIVENIRDVMAIERTGQFRGLYHVLGGLIDAMEGVGPNDIFIQDLPQRIAEEGVQEVVLALSTTMAGDTTNFYIYRLIKDLGVKISTIARGVAIGDELEYADDITLGRSILQRVDFLSTLKQ